MTTCISEPVSFLRLERYGLRELPGEEEQRIAQHLAACAVCRACFEGIQADTRAQEVAALAETLSRAPQPTAAHPRPTHPRPWWGAAAVVASLACLLFLYQNEPGSQTISPGQRSVATKGDGIALELVRSDAQGQLLDATRFAAGDRFKVLVSCPPSLSGQQVRVLAFQDGDVFEPVPGQLLSDCGNRRALSGAWQFDGQDTIELCAVFADAARVVRSPAGIPVPHACMRIEPVEPVH